MKFQLTHNGRLIAESTDADNLDEQAMTYLDTAFPDTDIDQLRDQGRVNITMNLYLGENYEHHQICLGPTHTGDVKPTDTQPGKSDNVG